MEIIKNEIRKAKKDHRCDFCTGTIKKGENYEYQFNKADGDTYEWKSHVKCAKLANYFNMYDELYGDGLGTDEFCDNIDEIFYKEFNGENQDFNRFQMIDALYERVEFLEAQK
jgi:hypothetical protein